MYVISCKFKKIVIKCMNSEKIKKRQIVQEANPIRLSVDEDPQLYQRPETQLSRVGFCKLGKGSLAHNDKSQLCYCHCTSSDIDLTLAGYQS